MDKKAYGEIVVESILIEYVNSEEYAKDAARYLYRWWLSILNTRAAQVGNQFIADTNGGDNVTKDSTDKFMAEMAKYNDLRVKMNELFGLLNDEIADQFRPRSCGKLPDKTPYPDFLKD